MNAQPTLTIEGLTAGYDGAPVLRNLDLYVGAGEVVALLGPNGAGKTTTLRAISGIVRPLAGTIRLAGEDLARRSPDARARLGIAHVPEGRGLFSGLTVAEHLRLAALGERLDTDAAYACFPALASLADRRAGLLSGGEQQMLALARALMLSPRLLLLDEPSLGLAPLVTAELFAIVRRLNEQEGLAVLVVEQNANLALEAASRAYVLEAGRVAVEGPSAELRANDDVRRSYLGY
jgi:branched-chain amino acid transport system ATP-binding protein